MYTIEHIVVMVLSNDKRRELLSHVFAMIKNKQPFEHIIIPEIVNGVYKSMNPLHYACMTDNSEATEWLLKNGADVNFATSDGFTALHWAAMKGHFECLQQLLKIENVIIEPLTVCEWTPLARAIQRLPDVGPDGDTYTRLRSHQLQLCIEVLLQRGSRLDIVGERIGKISILTGASRTFTVCFGKRAI